MRESSGVEQTQSQFCLRSRFCQFTVCSADIRSSAPSETTGEQLPALLWGARSGSRIERLGDDGMERNDEASGEDGIGSTPLSSPFSGSQEQFGDCPFRTELIRHHGAFPVSTYSTDLEGDSKILLACLEQPSCQPCGVLAKFEAGHRFSKLDPDCTHFGFRHCIHFSRDQLYIDASASEKHGSMISQNAMVAVTVVSDGQAVAF